MSSTIFWGGNTRWRPPELIPIRMGSQEGEKDNRVSMSGGKRKKRCQKFCLQVWTKITCICDRVILLRAGCFDLKNNSRCYSITEHRTFNIQQHPAWWDPRWNRFACAGLSVDSRKCTGLLEGYVIVDQYRPKITWQYLVPASSLTPMVVTPTNMVPLNFFAYCFSVSVC